MTQSWFDANQSPIIYQKIATFLVDWGLAETKFNFMHENNINMVHKVAEGQKHTEKMNLRDDEHYRTGTIGKFMIKITILVVCSRNMASLKKI